MRPVSTLAAMLAPLLIAACTAGSGLPEERSALGQPQPAPWTIECRYPDGTALPAPGIGPVPEEGPWADRLVDLWQRLAPADRAVLGATISAGSDAELVTSACSPNDIVWTHLALRNFTRPTADGVPRQMPGNERIRSFRVTPSRAQDLAAILAALDAGV